MESKNVKLIVNFGDYGYFHCLYHGDSFMGIHICQNLSSCTFKNKTLQAKSLCSGFITSSVKISDNKQSLFYKLFQEIEEIILKSLNKANIILKHY